MKLGGATAGRRTVAAQATLFEAGELAKNYYLVVSGDLLVHRRLTLRSKPVIRFMRRGDLFIYDCDGRHAANCHATTDCVVLPIERCWLDNVSRGNAALAGVLKSVHATELEMILTSLNSGTVSHLACPKDAPASAAPTSAQRNGIRALQGKATVRIAAARRTATNISTPATRH